MKYTVEYQTLQLSELHRPFHDYVTAESGNEKKEIAEKAFADHYEPCFENYSEFDDIEEAKEDARFHYFHGVTQGANMRFLEVVNPLIMYEGKNGCMEFVEY